MGISKPSQGCVKHQKDMTVLSLLCGFANENSLLKLLYAGILKAQERWSHPIQNWNLTLSQLSIHFEGRLDAHITL